MIVNKKIVGLCFLFLGILLYSIFLSSYQKTLAATPPTVFTLPASIVGNAVTLNGSITDDGGSPLATRSFEYGETTEYELTPDGVIFICDPIDGCPLGSYTGSVDAVLTCETEYHYRAYATNEAVLTGYGEDMTFTTGDCPLPAIITTLPATGIGLNSATLNGSIDFTENPLNQVGFSVSLIDSPNPWAEMNFFYQETENQPYEMGETFSFTMNNLSCSSTYTYSADGGEDVSFETLSCDPPVVTTDPATLIEEPFANIPSKKIFTYFFPLAIAAPGDTVVQLNGSIIDTGGEDPVAGFQYGTDTNYTGGTIPVGTFGVESYSSDLSSLALDTTYHYRAYATNSKATSYGEDQTFMIESPVVTPTVTTEEATSVRKSTAIFNGTITDIGGENLTVRGFEYGLTDSYDMSIEETGSFSDESFAQNVSDLNCGTTYHYRAYGTNNAGTGYGGDKTFTTSKCSTSVGNIPIETKPLPKDVCINIEGIQEIIPSGMELNSDGNCIKENLNVDVFPTLPVDVCPNIDETQEIIPSGMELNSDGNCIKENLNVDAIPTLPVDFCPNIDETQEIIPNGMEIDTLGNCILITQIPKEKNLDYYLFGFMLTLAGLATGLYINFIKNIFASPISFGEMRFIPVRLWNLLLAFLGLKKNRLPWGTVYDSVTKQPLDPVYVVLQDLNGKEVASSITDLDGRYGFLVGAGRYRIVANKTNYKFPSETLKNQTSDELYQDLYNGGIIDVADGEVITRNIPMDPLRFDWNEFEKKDKKLMKFFSEKQLWITRISNIIFYLGFLVTLISVITSPITYNIIILAIYALLYFLKKTILKPRVYGSIKDKRSNNPLSFAVIRVFFPDSENEVTHKVADRTGKYYCLVPNGTYYTKIENKNLDESYSLIHTSKPIEVKRGYINKKFEI